MIFAEMQVSSVPKLPKLPNSRDFSLAKIKCFTVYGLVISVQDPYITFAINACQVIPKLFAIVPVLRR